MIEEGMGEGMKGWRDLGRGWRDGGKDEGMEGGISKKRWRKG